LFTKKLGCADTDTFGCLLSISQDKLPDEEDHKNTQGYHRTLEQKPHIYQIFPAFILVELTDLLLVK
jgi:hypothetical protein